MYRKSIRQSRLEAKRKRCADMRRAKERKRVERGLALRDVGGLVTDGCLGVHVVRLLAYPEAEKHLAVRVDGKEKRARTLRGIVRVIAEMILKAKRKGVAHGGGD